MSAVRLVRIIVDPDVPAGEVQVGGGVRIVAAGDDAALGRELRTVEARVPDEATAAGLREQVRESPTMEMADD